MSSARTTMHRLTAAVTVVLALTASAAVAVTPATAAVQAPARTADAPITVETGIRVVSAGTTGFLGRKVVNGDDQYLWTTYADGTTRALDPAYVWYGGGSDIVFARKPTESSYFLHDMAAPPNPFWVGIDSAGTVAGVVDRTLVFTRRDSSGAFEITLKSAQPGSSQVTTRDVPLPTDARVLRAQAGTLDTALIQYARGTGDASTFHLAAVDLATGQVVETVRTGTVAPRSGVLLSASHFAWVENPTGLSARLVTVARGGGGERTSLSLGATLAGTSLDAAFVGGWALTAQKGGGLAEFASAQFPLVARDLGGSGTVRLLDHVDSMATAPDGSVLVRGGSTSKGGEGLYRIAPDGTGTPAATLVATTGRATQLGLMSSSVPAVVDLDRNGGRATLAWALSRPNAEGTVTLRHVATGAKVERSFSGWDLREASTLTFGWDGMATRNPGDMGSFAPGGAYVWELRAKPLNGIGPALLKTGTFKVARKAGPHDYTDNGSPDLLARDSSGRLFRDDTVRVNSSSEVYSPGRAQIGTGWQIYDRLEAVGDLAGGTAGDLVARDAAGVLWQYLGRGDGTFAPRTRIGSGWKAYDKITGGSDLDGDGRADLLAADPSGVLWYYRATGDWKVPFAGRVRVGGGWGAYGQITAVGNIAGTPHGDLVARDASGVLWLHQGSGNGGFSARVKVGGGWGSFTHLVGVGDADRDGLNDLYAVGASGSRLYAGTGSATGPFKPAAFTSVNSDAARFDTVF
ncbi:FG-GAP repeat domain-containing protein [Streptomyces sp. Qhu_M48]|uniref:FG-GAP repeat domain-containing protein n=1 Tax=Streptomyces sp. Qhu_M48 TaxID=3435889 RepID=UPI003F4F3FB8